MKMGLRLLLVAGFLGQGTAVAPAQTGAAFLESGPDRLDVIDEPRREARPAPFADKPAEAGAPPARVNSMWDISLDSLSATRERPIFSESRRPPAFAPEPTHEIAPIVEAEPAEPEPPPLTLLGTIVGGNQNVAIFNNPTAREVVKLRVGESDSGSGWTVLSIEPKTTTLEKDSHEVTLALPAPNSEPASMPDSEPMDDPQPFEIPSAEERPKYAPPPRGGPIPPRRAAIPSRLPMPIPLPAPDGTDIDHEF